MHSKSYKDAKLFDINNDIISCEHQIWIFKSSQPSNWRLQLIKALFIYIFMRMWCAQTTSDLLIFAYFYTNIFVPRHAHIPYHLQLITIANALIKKIWIAAATKDLRDMDNWTMLSTKWWTVTKSSKKRDSSINTNRKGTFFHSCWEIKTSWWIWLDISMAQPSWNEWWCTLRTCFSTMA